MLLSYRLFAAFFISSIQLVATSPLPQATATPVYKIEQASAPLVTSAATLEKRAIPVDGRRTETIGYRKVHPAQAAIYNQNHKFVYDVAFQSSPEAGGTQLGEGVYTAPDNSWPGNIGDWLCITRVDPKRFDSIDKIWIPAKDECGAKLWWSHETNIAAHIRKNDLDPDSTLRISRVSFRPQGFPSYQVLIPAKAIALLDARVDCFAPKDPALEEIRRPDVEFDHWKNVYNNQDRYNIQE